MGRMLYKVGDVVRIADLLGNNRNPNGLRDKYSSTDMTITIASDGVYRMKEDDKCWRWYPEMIAGFASDFEPCTPTEPNSDEPTDFPSDEELMKFLFQ